MVINQPITQVRLTNVAVVRLNRGGLRFEVACYPNKVRDWRNGLETDISEVLQSDRIFTNVGKGKFAPDAELTKEFGTTDVNEISKIILTKGKIQISEKERRLQANDWLAEVCTKAASRVISRTTKRPLTPEQLQNCLKQIRYRPKYTPSASAKAAVAKLLTALFDEMSHELFHALMKAQIICQPDEKQQVEEFLTKELGAQILDVSEDAGKVTFLYRAAPCDWSKQESFVQSALGPTAQFVTITMYDETTPDTLPLPPTRKKQEKKDGGQSQESSEESSESEYVASDDEGSVLEESTSPRSHPAVGYAALMSSSSSDDEESDPAVEQLLHVDDLLRPPAEHKKPRSKTVDLEHYDTRLRHRQLRELERKERERERKTQEALKAQEVAKKAAVEETVQKAETPPAARPNSAAWCAVCETDFGPASFRSHAQSEWHIFNQKRRVRNLGPISRAEFEDLSRDLREGFLAVEF